MPGQTLRLDEMCDAPHENNLKNECEAVLFLPLPAATVQPSYTLSLYNYPGTLYRRATTLDAKLISASPLLVCAIPESAV
jgi:hypothetical protein